MLRLTLLIPDLDTAQVMRAVAATYNIAETREALVLHLAQHLQQTYQEYAGDQAKKTVVAATQVDITTESKGKSALQ